jgi:hypothetical protein
LADDPSGDLILFCFAMVISPRLLITLAGPSRGDERRQRRTVAGSLPGPWPRSVVAATRDIGDHARARRSPRRRRVSRAGPRPCRRHGIDAVCRKFRPRTPWLTASVELRCTH